MIPVKEVVTNLQSKVVSNNTKWVEDAYFHAISAKYPKYLYRIGWDTIILYVFFFFLEKSSFKILMISDNCNCNQWTWSCCDSFLYLAEFFNLLNSSDFGHFLYYQSAGKFNVCGWFYSLMHHQCPLLLKNYFNLILL